MENNRAYETNPFIERLPPHLKQFIKPQNYAAYTAINQAVWRYVMRKNLRYLARIAHPSYVDGLRRTGIGIEKIPSMYGMNRILKEIGWAAVAVDGFIPPHAFMEFQAYKVLVIASEIRQLENIEYTPAPDIIHEAAGHAPIIANPDYAEYLRRLGDIGARAILSRHDMALYEAVRKLSILKEAEEADEQAVRQAGEEVDDLQNMQVPLSEMAKIRNLQWWSVEYGLIGSPENPKIYGAGLLSSIGESQWCMSDQVEKRPYSIAAADQDFDITRPQPHLYVTPDFSYLMEVLEELANTFSLRKGGSKGLQKLIDSKMIGTIELSTGLQVSGRFSNCILNEDREVIWFETTGPTALAYREKELIGHGTASHPEGFSSPLGKLKNINLAIEDMGPVDLKAYNFYDGKWLSFTFESGIHVKGLNITGIRNLQGKLMLIQLRHCTVTYKDTVLYHNAEGLYNMVVGKQIVSAFAGAADYNSFPNLYAPSEFLTRTSIKTTKKANLEILYQRVRSMREEGSQDVNALESIFQAVKNAHPEDWLLPLEILELSSDQGLNQEIGTHLSKLKRKNKSLGNLIGDGLLMVKK